MKKLSPEEIARRKMVKAKSRADETRLIAMGMFHGYSNKSMIAKAKERCSFMKQR